MQIDTKTKVLIDAYLQNDCQLWNLDTPFVKTWQLFAKDVQKKISSKIINDCSVKCLSKEKNKYIFCINDTPIIMYKQNKGTEFLYGNKKLFCWSAGGMRQFLQEGEAFGFIIFDLKMLSKMQTNDKIDVQFTNSFLQIFEKSFISNFGYYLMHSIQKGLTSAATYTANLGFTLFMLLLEKNNLNESDDVIEIEKKRNKSISGKCNNKIVIFGSNEYETILNDLTYTYKEAIEILQNNYSINTIIEHLTETFETNFIDFILTNEEENNELLKRQIDNIFKNISNERTQLRKNIITQRVGGKEKHNDLENTFPKDWYVVDCDAAHIYDIWRIKKRIVEELKTQSDITNLIKQCSDPDNGILMLKQWHYFFDKDLFKFNNEGKIIILTNINESDRLDPINFRNDLKNVKIKDSILNQQMIKYLNKRD